jgi:hypothetical protein
MKKRRKKRERVYFHQKECYSKMSLFRFPFFFNCNFIYNINLEKKERDSSRIDKEVCEWNVYYIAGRKLVYIIKQYFSPLFYHHHQINHELFFVYLQRLFNLLYVSI